MKLIATEKAHQNRAMVDPWTAVHFAAGLAFGLVNVPFRRSLLLAVGYEVVEQVLERQPWGKDLFQTSGPETISNAVMDLVVFGVGQRLGTAWNRTAARPAGERQGDAPSPRGAAPSQAASRG